MWCVCVGEGRPLRGRQRESLGITRTEAERLPRRDTVFSSVHLTNSQIMFKLTLAFNRMQPKPAENFVLKSVQSHRC